MELEGTLYVPEATGNAEHNIHLKINSNAYKFCVKKL
jgi:hypothetical protein